MDDFPNLFRHSLQWKIFSNTLNIVQQIINENKPLFESLIVVSLHSGIGSVISQQILVYPTKK